MEDGTSYDDAIKIGQELAEENSAAQAEITVEEGTSFDEAVKIGQDLAAENSAAEEAVVEVAVEEAPTENVGAAPETKAKK